MKPAITAIAELEKFVAAAAAAGCPADQVQRFIAAGYFPQPKQLEFHAAARAADNPANPNHIGVGGDRAGAKSHAIFAQVIIDDCQRYPGLDVLYLRKVGKAAKKALAQLREKVLYLTPHEYSAYNGLITLPNGSSVVVGHFRDDNDIAQYQGIEFDLIVIEESTQLKKETKDLLNGSLRSSKPGWRIRQYEAANPGGIGHQTFKQKYIIPHRHGRFTDTFFIPMSWRDNVFTDPDYIKYLNGLTGVLRRMWRDGDWDVGVGQYFTNWNHDIHIVKAFDIPTHWPMWAALDHGHAHPTAVGWFTKDDDGKVYQVAEYGATRRLVPAHAERINEISEDVLQRPVHSFTAFVAGHDCFAQRGDEKGKTIAQQYLKHGIKLTKANINRVSGAAEMLGRLGNKEDGIEPSWFIFDTCTETIDTIPRMMQDPKRPEDVLKQDANPAGEDGDDFYDMARYGLMVNPKPQRPMRRRSRAAAVRRGASGSIRPSF
jgi:phage terminase large subunit